jgi:hypothetical protein
VAKNAYVTFKGRLSNLLDQLWLDTNGNGTIDSAGVDGGLLPQLVARAQRPGATAADSAPLDMRSNVTTVAKGALYNGALAATEDRPYFASGHVLGSGFAAHRSAGNGVHNPFLLEALLTSSIDAVRTAYGLPSPPIDLRVHATAPPGVRARIGQ